MKGNQFRQIINAYRLSDWKPLFDLIPLIEGQKKFGHVIGGEITDDEIIMPVYRESPIVVKFRDIVYQIPIMIDFDWGSWDQGL